MDQIVISKSHFEEVCDSHKNMLFCWRCFHNVSLLEESLFGPLCIMGHNCTVWPTMSNWLHSLSLFLGACINPSLPGLRFLDPASSRGQSFSLFILNHLIFFFNKWYLHLNVHEKSLVCAALNDTGKVKDAFWMHAKWLTDEFSGA